ncbi:MAG TPA: hypothetical protein VGP99_04190 [Tepidisphaeraceae bacterium]|jgi:hypothetical protein|nr:hypothetical protein [Tepidisphaeraceae bacterium]
MPTTRHAYFAGFTPDALALLSEATLLAYKTQSYQSISNGFLWAAVRAVERGEATCQLLRPLDSTSVEEHYKSSRLPFDAPRSLLQVEDHQFYNSLEVLRHRTAPNEPISLPTFGPITSATILAAIIGKYDFSHDANIPLWEFGIEPRHAYERLSHPGSFEPHEFLICRGQIPPTHLPLYTLASQRAAFVGTWIITSTIAQFAAQQLNYHCTDHDNSSIRNHWATLIRHARQHASGDHCCYLLSFPGPHPWTAAAAPILGLESPPT